MAKIFSFKTTETSSSTFFNLLACICGWASIGLGIASITSNSWLNSDSLGDFQGLWSQCNISACSTLVEAQPWLYATRTLMILMLSLAFLVALSNLVFLFRCDKVFRQCLGIVYLLSALCGVSGTSVYTGFMAQTISEGSFIYGAGFILSWIGVGLLFIASISLFISSSYTMSAYAA